MVDIPENNWNKEFFTCCHYILNKKVPSHSLWSNAGSRLSKLRSFRNLKLTWYMHIVQQCQEEQSEISKLTTDMYKISYIFNSKRDNLTKFSFTGQLTHSIFTVFLMGSCIQNVGHITETCCPINFFHCLYWFLIIGRYLCTGMF